MAGLLAQSMGMIATSGGTGLGAAHPVNTTVMAASQSLVFIAIRMFNFAIVNHAILFAPRPKRSVTSIQLRGTPFDSGQVQNQIHSFHDVCSVTLM